MANVASVLAEALKLTAEERVRVAETLLESADADAPRDLDHPAATLEQRSRELRDGTVRGLSVEDARRAIASDDDQ